jgi:hypothetical protein
MKKVARELKAVSSKLKELISFGFTDVESKKCDFVNAICTEIDDLADRIRRNEGLKLVVERSSEGSNTAVRIRMTDHEALKAIREEIAEKIGKMGKKKKIDVKVLK